MAKIAIDMKSGNLKQEREVIVGIDLGTTNSLVAFIDEEGKPQVIKGSDGSSKLVPSIVHFLEDDDAVIGDSAREQLILNPKKTIYSVKRLLGKVFSDIESYKENLGYELIDDDTERMIKIKVGERFYNPVDLSALILKELKQRAERALNKPVKKAVITVPAYFNDAQRQATRDAGKLAGLDVLRIVNEPTAASMAYGLQQNGEFASQTVAVYDLGGGTFDLSILRLEEGIFEVLSTKGDTFLGGDDIDKSILNYWQDQKNVENKNLDKQSQQELRLLAEEAKKHLSKNEVFEATHSALGLLALSRQELDTLITPIIVRTLELCTLAMDDAEVTKSEIDRVVMVGGSTRDPFIKQEVSKYFGKEVFDDINPDEVVALGAAVQADVLSGRNKDILLLDITPLSLGIETVGGLMDVIIPRNSKIPNALGREYTTSVDGQKNLKISVYQGERDLVADNRKLGEFILRDIPPMPAGIPKIEIKFLLDADGILKVSATELRSGVKQNIVVKPAYGITQEEMALMLKASLQNAEEDMQKKALIEAQNEGNHILAAAQKFLSQNSSWLTTAQQERIAKLASSLSITVEKGTKDDINASIDEINKYTRPFAEKAMDMAVSGAVEGKKLE